MKINCVSLICEKEGMTRYFDQFGNCYPVTVLKILPTEVIAVKELDRDGYEAYGVRYKTSSCEKMRMVEIRQESVSREARGSSLCLDWCMKLGAADVVSVSKGKGFQGVVKRYNFSGGPMSHGSHFHRKLGSIGNRATPARVFAGKKMPGQMGRKKVTVQNLKILYVDQSAGLILLRGAVPGASGAAVLVRKSVKLIN
jgi:large subunit ribosomal protein L3